jgi:PAS domain S-box-containing protein
MFDQQDIERAAFEEVLRQMPAAVIVVEARSGEIVFTNTEAQQWTEQVLGQRVPSELGQYRDLQIRSNFQMLHPDGRSYEVEEWPLTRSIRSGEEIRDEEIIYRLADGSRLWSRYNSSPIHNDEGRIVAGVAVVYDITEQKRSEEERAYHAYLLENIHDAVTATDERYIITAWNKGAEQMFGWRADEALGRSVYELIPTDYGDEQLEEALRELSETGRRRSEGLRYSKDGTPLYAEALTIALRGEQGEITGYLGIHRDITERKRAEEQLRFQADLLGAVGQAVIATDLEGRIIYWNRSAQDLYGFSAEEVMGRPVVDITPSEAYLERVEEIMLQLRAGRSWSGEFEVRRKDGTSFPAMVTDTPVHDEQGNLVGVIGISTDITERKRAEREIERRTHQQAVVADLGLRALAEHDDLQALMNEAVALVARTLDVEYSKIVELLPGGEELLLRAGVGWREGLVGKARERAGLGSQAGYTALISNEAVIVEDLREETRFEPPPLLVEHGVVSGMTVVIPSTEGPFGVLGAHTTSHRTFSEDDINFLQAVANVLATAIERRQAQQKLDEVTEAERSRIARDLHDEALQDLSGALVDAQRLEALSTDPEVSRLSERLLATLDRMGPHLRGAIYDLRLEREHDRPFDVLLEELVELQRTMAPHLKIALDMQAGTLEGSLGETGREILRIIGEALTNACRHSEATSVWVRVGISNGILYGEVEDDGRGFGPTQPPTAATTGGGGVGIRAMRERANHLGGELNTESEPGQGTKVRFELVLHREELEEAEQEEEVHILIVDDHASIREALASSFEEEEGFEVVGQAGSLSEARRMLEKETQKSIDVAVLDLGLPDGYGGDLIKEMHEKNPRAQALVLSASLDRAQIARAVECGAAGVLNKTAHLDEVVGAVRRLRAGETLMPLEEVVELLRFASARRDEEYEARQAIESLTSREIEVLQALAEGLDSRQIAERLHISLRTERNHMTSILAKLGVHSQLQALVLAQRHGVVEIR